MKVINILQQIKGANEMKGDYMSSIFNDLLKISKKKLGKGKYEKEAKIKVPEIILGYLIMVDKLAIAYGLDYPALKESLQDIIFLMNSNADTKAKLSIKGVDYTVSNSISYLYGISVADANFYITKKELSSMISSTFKSIMSVVYILKNIFAWTDIEVDKIIREKIHSLTENNDCTVVPTSLKVTLLATTPNPDMIAATGGRLCYSKGDVSDTVNEMKDDSQVNKIMNILKASGHMSPLEHTYFTFGIEGISRASSHQLVRHRLFSYSQKSQRYVAEADKLNIVIPESKIGDDSFINKVQIIFGWYKEELAKGIKAEDARSLLPNCTETKLVMSGNGRAIIEFLEKRLCNRAQTEIRNLAKEILKLCEKEAPKMFNNVGPGCLNGPCPEGKLTCGHPYKNKKNYHDVKRT